MSDDMFDGMITSNGANTLFAAADMFGRQQANNQLYGQQAAGLQQDMMQFTMQQNAQAASERQQSRQFQLQSQQEDRKLAALREESAFARLNQSLDRQLKYAEMESQERQQAFENTLRAQQAGLQAQLQSMQIQQIETAMNAQKAIGVRTRFKMEAATNGLLSDPLRYSEALQKHLKDNQPLYDALGQTPEGQKMLMEDAQLVQAIKMYSTDLYSIDPDMVADSINVGKMEEIAKNMKLGDGAPKGNDRQVLAFIARRASREVTEADVEAEFGHVVDISSLSPSELALYKVRTLAAKNDGIDHWDAIASQLEQNPAAALQFETLHANGLLEPVADRNVLARLQAIDQSKMQMMSQAMAASNGAFLIAPEYAEAREALDDQYEVARNEALSGGNPSGAFALGGAVSFDIVNDKMKEQVRLQGERQSILSAAYDITGIPGALRAGKGLATGDFRSVSKADWVDAALWATAVFTGGGSLAVKGATGIGKFALGKAMAKVGVKGAQGAAMAAAGKAAMTSAGRQLIGREAILFGRRGASVAKAQAAFARSQAASRAFADAATRAATGRAAGATAAQWTARAGEAAARSSALNAKMLAGSVVPRTAAQALVVGAGANAVGVAREGAYGFEPLDTKAQRVAEIVDQFKLKSHPPMVRAQLANELGAAMRDYQATAARYFPGGTVPAGVMSSMLNLGNMVPKTVLRQLQRDLNAGNPAMYGGVAQINLSQLLGGTGASSGGLTMVGAPAATSGTGMDDLFNRPQQ